MSCDTTDDTIYVSIEFESPQWLLMQVFKNNNIFQFREIILNQHADSKGEGIDVNYLYDNPHYGTLLDIACSQKGKSEFVNILIQNGAEIDSINAHTSKTPLHTAVKNSDTDTVKCLIRSKRLSGINERDGNNYTALHIAVALNKEDVIVLLFEHPDLDVNATTDANETPLYLAFQRNYVDIINLLVHRFDINLDYETNDGQTYRNKITQEYPGLWLFDKLKENITEIIRDHGMQTWTLSREATRSYIKIIQSYQLMKLGIPCMYLLLTLELIEEFLKLARSNCSLLNNSDNQTISISTYLQIACEKNLTYVVENLLQLGADCNHHYPDTNPPLVIAVFNGFYDVVQALRLHPDISFDIYSDKSKTILHVIFEGIQENISLFIDSSATERDRDTKAYDSYYKCLKNLLVPYINKFQYRSIDGLNPNLPDSKGDTSLHCAANIPDGRFVKHLLNHGAYIGEINNYGEYAFEHIKPSILQEYMDDCISHNIQHSTRDHHNYTITYQYEMLIPSALRNFSGKHNCSETEPLLKMCTIPEFGDLLKHPLITSFLHLKWITISSYYYINIAFHFANLLILTLYIYNVHGCVNPETSNALQSYHANYSHAWLLWCITLFLCILLYIRELFQFIVSPKLYLESTENWLEISLIVSTLSMLFQDRFHHDSHPELATVSILACAYESILLLGRHPKLSINIEIFKTVVRKCFMFFVCYAILILAFGFSFYILFSPKFNCDANDDKLNNTFRNLWTSIFKVEVMMTGDLNVDTVPFHNYPIFGHVFFLLFTFTITIVLFGFLNGVVVSNIQDIRDDTEIIAIKSRIALISYLERMTNNNIFLYLKSFCQSKFVNNSTSTLRQSTDKKVKLFNTFFTLNFFPDILFDGTMQVYPRTNYIVEPRNNTLRSSWQIDPNILKASQAVLEKREKSLQCENSENLQTTSREIGCIDCPTHRWLQKIGKSI